MGNSPGGRNPPPAGRHQKRVPPRHFFVRVRGAPPLDGHLSMITEGSSLRAVSKGGQNVEKTIPEESVLGIVEAPSIHPGPGCALAELVDRALSRSAQEVGLCALRLWLSRRSAGPPRGSVVRPPLL